LKLGQKANATQEVLLEASRNAQEKLKIKRQESNDLIVKIWNETEKSLENMPAHEKRKNAEAYGIVYVFRKHEKQFAEDLND